MTQKILAATSRPTAIFAANNFIAIGALRALRDAGFQVPVDMSVVSFDDIPETISFDPFLTVVAQPTYEMGYRAAELLLTRLAAEGPTEYQSILLPTEIIVRRSSARLARRSSEGLV
jgi:LacI family transcriptional regulator